jgi:hypothetical protein
MLAPVPEEKKDAVLNEIEERLRATNYKDGSWFIDYRRLRILAYKEPRARN